MTLSKNPYGLKLGPSLCQESSVAGLLKSGPAFPCSIMWAKKENPALSKPDNLFFKPTAWKPVWIWTPNKSGQCCVCLVPSLPVTGCDHFIHNDNHRDMEETRAGWALRALLLPLQMLLNTSGARGAPLEPAVRCSCSSGRAQLAAAHSLFTPAASESTSPQTFVLNLNVQIHESLAH